MRSLAKLKKSWEGLAQADPLWAICVDPDRRGRKWTKDELLATGRSEVATILSYLQSLGISIDRTAPALDFGCGVGRLTRALAEYFPECWGVDISPTMIQLASEFHRADPRCQFYLNDTDRLQRFSDGYFGFIYTSIVLQHIPRENVANYLREFARMLRRGGVLVFQVADSDKTGAVQRLRNFLGFRRKWKRILRPADVDSFHMAMHCIAEREIRRMLAGTGLRIIDVQITNSTEGSFNGDLRFLECEPSTGYVSKQYCAARIDSPGPV